MAAVYVVETTVLTAVVSGGAGIHHDKIVLFQGEHGAESPSAVILDWFFLNGTKTVPSTAPLKSGQCVFTRPANGTYTVQLVQSLHVYASYQAGVIADGAQYYYRLGEASGTTAIDAINAFNGTIAGGVTLGVPGLVVGNPAMSFNGVDGRITMPTTLTLPMGSFAVEAWIKQTKTTDRHHCIWTNRDPVLSATGIDVFYFGTQEIGGVLKAYVSYNGIAFLGVTDIGDGLPHHILFRADINLIGIYVDGRVDLLQSYTRLTTPFAGGPPAIGRDPKNPTATQFNGVLDEVAVYFTQLLGPKAVAHYAMTQPTIVMATEQVLLRPEPFVCLEMEFLGKNQGWTIVRDWYRSQGIAWHRGLPGIQVLDLIADIGTMNFTLDNSEKNSAGKVGYYSPDHANKRYGFYLNIGVRVRIGNTKRFTGVISSIDPLPGKYGARTVSVECTDWMGVADRTRIENLPVQVNKRGDEVFQTLLNSLPGSARPDGVQADLSPDIYPYTLDRTRDEETVLRDELYRLCTSGLARIYVLGDGTLVYENRGRRASVLQSVDTFTDSHGFSASQGREAIVNRAQATIHPRLPSITDVVMYSMPQPVPIVIGVPLTIMGPWTDPANPNTRVGAVSLVPLAATTDYMANEKADGTGANLTASLIVSAGLSGNATTFTISLPQGGYLTKLQQRGKPLYDYGEAILTWEDTTSIAQFGVAAQQVDMPYTADPGLAQEVAQFTVYNGAFPLTNVSGFMRVVDIAVTQDVQRSIIRQISDRISITDSVTGISKPFFINAVDETISDNRLQTQWLLVPADVTGYWLLEVDGYTELDITTRLAFGQILGHVDLVHQDVHGDSPHYDVVHSDTHTDNVHVDVTHVDVTTHTDQAIHQDNATHSDQTLHDDAHSDVTHQDGAHSDGAHTDVAGVSWHTDSPHTDVAHYDVYYDSPHQDIPHANTHNDVWNQVPAIQFQDHIDCDPAYSKPTAWHKDCYSKPMNPPGGLNPNGEQHTDQEHGDQHTDGSGLHDDYSEHIDIAHEDYHGDSHSDSHADQRHVDEGYFEPHQDVPAQSAHGDVIHQDVPHYDVAHVDVTHVDVHADTGSHTDSVLHSDQVDHYDSVAHQDVPHTDVSHGDVTHQDVSHQDVLHQDSHQDFHGDLN